MNYVQYHSTDRLSVTIRIYEATNLMTTPRTSYVLENDLPEVSSLSYPVAFEWIARRFTRCSYRITAHITRIVLPKTVTIGTWRQHRDRPEKLERLVLYCGVNYFVKVWISSTSPVRVPDVWAVLTEPRLPQTKMRWWRMLYICMHVITVSLAHCEKMYM